MNFRKLVKIGICAMVLSAIFVNVCAASVSSDMTKYSNANEKEFNKLNAQAVKDFTKISSLASSKKNTYPAVFSDSANFENSNVPRAVEILNKDSVRLHSANGQIETMKISAVDKKYEFHVFTKGTKSFKTDGSLSGNAKSLKNLVPKKSVQPAKHTKKVTTSPKKVKDSPKKVKCGYCHKCGKYHRNPR
ncbi:MAG: hypothetical protein WC178_04255 [Candidatus Paceibacterota bacterium]